MNDKALYQLERAIDALTEMAKYLREESQINISTNVKYDDHMGVYAPYVYTGSGVKGAWGDDVISFGGDTVVSSNVDTITFS